MKTAVLTVFISYLVQAGWANEVCSSSKPNFKAPGRRISEEKCREYSWERKCSATKDVEVNEHPYLGAVAFKDEDGKMSFSCAATLISPTFAVTTAHCLNTFHKLTPEFVRFGNKNIKAESVTDAKIVNKILHPLNKRSFHQYDIGLLQFDKALPVNKAITPACLWSQEISSEPAKVSAWGTTRDNRQVPDILKTMTVQIMDAESCMQAASPLFNRKFPKLEDHHLCVNESDPNEYFCLGASGAPIVASAPVEDGEEMSYVKAFATFGVGCNRGVSFYTKIPSFVEWIEQIVWGSTPI